MRKEKKKQGKGGGGRTGTRLKPQSLQRKKNEKKERKRKRGRKRERERRNELKRIVCGKNRFRKNECPATKPHTHPYPAHHSYLHARWFQSLFFVVVFFSVLASIRFFFSHVNVSQTSNQRRVRSPLLSCSSQQERQTDKQNKTHTCAHTHVHRLGTAGNCWERGGENTHKIACEDVSDIIPIAFRYESPGRIGGGVSVSGRGWVCGFVSGILPDSSTLRIEMLSLATLRLGRLQTWIRSHSRFPRSSSVSRFSHSTPLPTEPSPRKPESLLRRLGWESIFILPFAGFLGVVSFPPLYWGLCPFFSLSCPSASFHLCTHTYTTTHARTYVLLGISLSFFLSRRLMCMQVCVFRVFFGYGYGSMVAFVYTEKWRKTQ